MKTQGLPKFLSIRTIAAFLVVLASGLAVHAQTTFTWTNLLNGSWAATANWNGGLVASGSGNTADFSELTLGSSRAVTLDGARTIGNIIFGDQGNTYNWALTTGSGGPLTLSVPSGSPTLTVNNGTATNGAALTGTAGMTKTGAGTLYLTTQATYTGGTTVTAGTLKLGTGGSGGCVNGVLTILPGATVAGAVANALGYSGSAASQVTTLNVYGGTFTELVTGDEGYGLAINLMGGTISGSGDLSMGSNAAGNYVVSTIATNVTSTISCTINTRSPENGPFNQIPFNVAAGTATPDLLVSGVINATTAGYGIAKNGPGVMSLTGVNTYSGMTTVNAGTLQLSSSSSGNGCVQASRIYVAPGAELDCNASDAMGYAISLAITNAGTLKKINAQSETLFRPLTLSNGVVTATSASSSGESYNFFGNYIQTLSGTTNLITSGSGGGRFDLRTSGTYFNVAANSTLTIACVVSNYASSSTGVPFSMTGGGLLVLSGANAYTGATSITNGLLEVDGRTGIGAVTIFSGATLYGSGTVQGSTTINSGGTLEVGTNDNLGTPVGTLAINNTLTLSTGSTNLMRLSKTGGAPVSDLLQGITSLTYGGTLVLTNVTSDGTLLAAGDTFTLFNSSAYSGGFAAYVLPALPAGLSWNKSQLLINGTVTVISGTTPPSFSPPGGGYVGALSVTISSDAGATIYYTTDGSNPTTSGTRVSGISPVSGIVIPVGTTETLMAYATNSTTGASASPVISATYATVPTAVWTNNASGTWGVPVNWNEAAVGNASGVTAEFSTLMLNSNLVVSVGGSETIGTMLFEDQGATYNWALTGGTLTMNAGTAVPSIVVSNQSVNISTTLASTNGLYIYGAGAGAVTLSSLNNNFTNLTLNGVSVTNTTAAGSTSTTFDLGAKVAANTITINSNSMLTLSINNVFGGSGMTNTTLPTLVVNGLLYSSRYNALPNLVLNGGTLDVDDSSDGGTYQGFQFVGNITVGGSAASTIESDIGRSDQLLGSGTTFNVAPTGVSGPDLTIACGLTNSSGDYGNSAGVLIKTGAGTMAFAGANTYTGSTTVSNGTLEVDGSTGAGTLALNGGTLDGTGTINGIVTLNGGTLSAGTAAATGTLTIYAALSLSGGTTALRINKTGGSTTSDEVSGIPFLTYGGTLTVTNATSDGTPLAAGDTFYLFSASIYSGVFTILNLPLLPAGLFWDTSGLTANGSIAVTATAPTPVFSPTAGGYVGTLTVKISSATGSTIFYTTDGSDPMSSGTVMSSPTPATVVIPVNTPSEQLIAYAYLAGGGAGPEASATFSTISTPTWENSGGGNWSGAYNWLYNVVANGINETADFSTQTLGGDTTVNLDIAPTVGNLLFADQGNAYNWFVTPTGAGPLTLNVSSGSPTITVENESTFMEASLAGTNGLTVAGAGSLVLTNFNFYSGNTVVNGGNLILATNSTGEGTINGTLTVLNGGTATATVANALGYTNATNPRILWVPTLNLFGGTFAATATNADQGFGLTINLMGGTVTTTNGSRIAAGSGTVVNTLATNMTSVIAGIFNARENNPSNQIPFNVAGSGGAASPDLLVSATIANATAGVGIVKNGTGVMALGSANTFSGSTIVSNGVLQLTGGGGSNGTLSNSPVTVEIGAELQLFTPDGLGSTYNAVRTLTLNGGTLREINTNSDTLSRPITLINGRITANAGTGLTAGGAILAQGSPGDCYNLYGATAIMATTPGTTNYINLPTGTTFALRGGSFSNAASAYLIVNANLNGWGGSSAYPLTVNGPGAMVLNSSNSYSGSTTVNAGNLEVDGSIAGAAGTVTVNGGILDGNGTINSPTTVAPGGTLMAGTVASRGTLSISNVLTLDAGATNLVRISKTGGALAGDLLQGMVSVTYGGTLLVTNLTSDGTQFAVGDTLHLFNSSSYAGSFASIQGLPSLSNSSWSWDTSQLLVNGTIRVISGTGTPSYSPPGGNYVGAQSVTITSDAGSTIFYTTDGSNPTTSGTRISGASPLSGITVPVGITETINAYATNSGNTASLVASATYVTVPTAVWTNTAGGSWPIPANWNVGAVGNGSGVTADLSTLTLTTNTTVLVGGSQTIGTLLFGDQGNTYGWLLGGNGTLTVDAGITVPRVVVNNQSVSIAPTIAGTNGLIKAGAGLLSLTAANSYSGTTVVSNGVLELSGNGGSLGTISNSPVIVEKGAELQAFAGDVLGYTYNPVRTLTLNGGDLREVNSNSETLGRPITMINGTITANAGAGATATAVAGDCYNLFNATAVIATAPNTTNYLALPAGCTFALRGGSFSNGASAFMIVNANLKSWEANSSFSLITTGPGTMLLNSNNVYNGSTIVSNGTLDVEGSISNSTVTVDGGTLEGNGLIGGDVEVMTGGTLAAGNPAAIGTLTINNTLELAGTVALRVNKTGGALTGDKVLIADGVSYGGVLTVTASGSGFAAGDTFTLFTAPGYGGAFNTTNLPALPGGLGWDAANLAVNGSIQVVAGLVNTNPTNITYSVSGNLLQLSWPADHTGWELQVQTNHLATGVSVNPADWSTMAGSAGTNQVSVPIDPAQSGEYYRLFYP